MTRRELGRRIGASPAAVTKYVRWLADQKLLIRELHPRAWSKRPVEDLRVNPDAGRCLCLVIRADRIDAELVAMDGTPLTRWSEPVEAPHQAPVFEALRRAARAGQVGSDGPLTMVGMAVKGFTANDTVFDVEGVDDWDPCQPGLVLDILEHSETAPVYPEVMCRLSGFAARHGNHRPIAYVHLDNGRFQIASVENGLFVLGGQGTTSPLVHQSVSDSREQCLCGRPGCLAWHIRTGTARTAMLAAGLLSIAGSIGTPIVALDVGPDHADLASRLQAAGIDARTVEDGAALVPRGLATLTAAAGLQCLVAQRGGGSEHGNRQPDRKARRVARQSSRR
jgi:predicted NBD/HSP70 family sugar kinase